MPFFMHDDGAIFSGAQLQGPRRAGFWSQFHHCSQVEQESILSTYLNWCPFFDMRCFVSKKKALRAITGKMGLTMTHYDACESVLCGLACVVNLVGIFSYTGGVKPSILGS